MGLVSHFQPLLDSIAGRGADRAELPRDDVRALAEAGFGRIRIPASAGGFGASLSELGELLVELAAADSNLVQIWRGHIAFVEDVLRSPDPQFRERWTQRIVAGAVIGNAWSEIGSVERGTLATRVSFAGKNARVSGEKFYTTGTIYADYADTTVADAEGRQYIAVVPLHQAGARVSDDWDGFGQQVTGTGTLTLDAAEVPREDVFPFERRFGYQTALYQWVLLGVLAGIAESVTRDAAAAVSARERTYSHATADRVRDDPQVLQTVGQIAACAYSSRAVVARVSAALDEAAAAPSHAADLAAELESAKGQVVLSRSVPEAATALFDALGASAVRRGAALDRHWRNARTVASHNPWLFKARAIGDYAVNGTEPTFVWSIGTVKKSA